MTERKVHSIEKLARALDAAGLTEMAKEARKGYYHDYLSPLDFPEMQLDADLLLAIAAGNTKAQEIRKLHHQGEWDATKEESDAWAESPEGKAAYAELTRKGN